MHLQQYPEFAIHRAKRWMNSKRGIEWAVSKQVSNGLKPKTLERHCADRLANQLAPPRHIMQTILQFNLEV